MLWYPHCAPPTFTAKESIRYLGFQKGFNSVENIGWSDLHLTDPTTTTKTTCCAHPDMVADSFQACRSCGNKTNEPSGDKTCKSESCCEVPELITRNTFKSCLHCDTTDSFITIDDLVKIHTARQMAVVPSRGSYTAKDSTQVESSPSAVKAFISTCCHAPNIIDDKDIPFCQSCGQLHGNTKSAAGEHLSKVDYNSGSNWEDQFTVKSPARSAGECCNMPTMKCGGFQFCANCGTYRLASFAVTDNTFSHESEGAAVISEEHKAAETPDKPGRQCCDAPCIKEKAGQRLSSNCSMTIAESNAELAYKTPSNNVYFTKFIELPSEIRERVYHFMLTSDQPIAPHLCDANSRDDGHIKFHDEMENHGDRHVPHNATYIRMAITRVSRFVRYESLPIFYSANTFVACADLSTYFERLAHLDRFHMIRNVTFSIDFTREYMAPKALRDILQNISEQEAYEKKVLEAHLERRCELSPMETVEKRRREPRLDAENYGSIDSMIAGSINLKKTSSPEHAANESFGRSAWPLLKEIKPGLMRFYTNSRTELVKHPQHIVGGLRWISTFLVLRKLAAEFTSTTSSEYSHKLVLHVPSAQIFATYDTLTYIPTICEGLGIKLHFVEGRDVECGDWGIKLSWHQKYQKKDLQADSVENRTGGRMEQTCWDLERITKRVRDMYPDLEQMRRPVRNSYYRKKCRGLGIEWFSVDSAGGGRL
jgi:hypothetical protein